MSSQNRNIIEKHKRFIPVLAILALIIFLTCQSHDDTLRNSYGMRDFFINLFPKAYGKWTTDIHWFRSLLHIPLYFLLGILAQFSVVNTKKSVLVCSIVAVADETLKFFLPTREFEVRDLFIDAIGYILGIVIAVMIRYCICKVKNLECKESK